MKPASFDYFAPSSLDEAISQLDSMGPEARVLAGGQSLIPAMNMRMARPSGLVDLNSVAELSFIKEGPAGLHVGAMTRQRMLERSAAVGRRAKLIQLALPHVAHFQIRNRGTLGGSIAQNDPAAELPAVLAALDATVTLTGPKGRRDLHWNDFFCGIMSTSAASNEVITSIFLPELPSGTGHGFAEVNRRHGDFALVGAAAALHVGSDHSIDMIRLVLFGVGEGPVRVRTAEKALHGQVGDHDLWEHGADLATCDINPADDLHASGTYRRELTVVLVNHVLRQAWDEAIGYRH